MKGSMDLLLVLFTQTLILMFLQIKILGIDALPYCHSQRYHSPFYGGRGGDVGVESIISEDLFQKLFLHRNDAVCPAHGFYSYSAFLNATLDFPCFGNVGDLKTRKREVAAFLAQISHETTGGWATAPDGRYSWGLCYKEEVNQQNDYCDQTSTEWPCVPGIKYYGRGPIQLSWNFNYGPAGKALGFDGLKHPEVVSSDPTISFKAALWFWMTCRPPKPSCHDVITGCHRPTAADKKAGRLPGFGLVTNIINGGLECGHGQDDRVNDRVGFYERYSQILNVNPGSNLDCANQTSY